MDKIFSNVDKFFGSLQSYLTYNDVFLIFVGLFLVTVIAVVVSTAHSYESKLIKAIDMFNNYFIDNPKITEDNLVAFNQKMRHKKVPKQLRKQWQQFVLYRENKASFYMSFENCVSIPLRNSKMKRDRVTMNLIAYILSAAAFILNIYFSYEADLATILQRALLVPVIILLANFIVTIFLDLKANAVVSDLYQNYQYFEVNIDKATQTLPEYVDYEVLFDRNEIRRGIPILYQYLQRRAEEEQRELEKARLKNVEHEKFNFDEAGLAGSLVLERAMHEAENYIAERKKYNQDIEQINSEITQEDMNYREITKEYNRQMQVSRETFANFKAQLEQATSTIETNYLKKQQQQELDRQRNLERDFDTATERHKKVIESYQAELDAVDEFIAKSRKSLQDAMMSEFSTYSGKVYDEAKKVVEVREEENNNKKLQEIKNLEEQLYSKNKELESVYNKNLELSQKLESMGIALDAETVKPSEMPQPVQEVKEEAKQEEYTPLQEESEQVYKPLSEEVAEPAYTPLQEETVEEESEPVYKPLSAMFEDETNETESTDEQVYKPLGEVEEESTYKPLVAEEDENSAYVPKWNFGDDDNKEDSITEEGESSNEELDKSTIQEDEGENEEKLFNWLKDEEDEESEEGENLEESDEEPLEIKPELEMPIKKKAGRPRKIVDESQVKPKGKPGRPRKEKTEVAVAPKKGRGRPRKVEIKEEVKQSKGRGRPRKEETKVVAAPKKGRGRPKKVEAEQVKVSKGRGRPRKTEVQDKPKATVGRGRPKKQQTTTKVEPKKGRGRPKKAVTSNSSVDFEQYLKVIESKIAEENAKIEKSQKALESKTNLTNKNKK